MDAPLGPPRDRTLSAAVAFAGVSALLLAAAVLYVGQGARRGWAANAPLADASTPRPPEARTWTPIVAGSPLSVAVDVAFAAGSSLATDGKRATLDPGEGAPRPLEVPTPISRVFAATGRLFAAGENEGAPFLILLARGEEPLVVPVPCALARLAGEGNVLAGSCAEGTSLAVSADGGKSFRPVPVEIPAPREAGEVEPEQEIEAVAVNSAGMAAVATAQRWQSPTPGGVLAWTLGQVAVRAGPGKPFRFSSVHALVRSVGLYASGGALTLAGLEVALDGPGEGEAHPRLFRGPEGEPLVAVGEPGPSCGTVAQARGLEGVLLGERIAAMRCGDGLAITLDGGASWRLEPLGPVQLLRGGDMRLFARAGDKAFERRFVNRSESGATAVRLLGVALPRRDGGEAGPLAPAFGIREPGNDDAGAGDAVAAVDAAAADAGDADATP